MDRVDYSSLNRVLQDETWYLANRYGKLWNVVASALKSSRHSRRKRGFKKATHLIINELKNSGHFQAVEALKAIAEDMKLPYDADRLDRLISDFFLRNNDAC